MRISSILSMLDQAQFRGKVPQKKKLSGSGLEKIEIEIAIAAKLAKPPETQVQPAVIPSAQPVFGELLRAITKFEEMEESRVLDIFE